MANENTVFFDDEIPDGWIGDEDEWTKKLFEDEIEYQSAVNEKQKDAVGAYSDESVKTAEHVVYEAEFEQELKRLAERENADDTLGVDEFDLDELEIDYEYYYDTLGARHLRTVRAKYDLALAYWKNGDESMTYQMLHEVYWVWKDVKDGNDPDMLELKHTLGMAAFECEYPDEAYAILKEVYTLRCDAIGENHPDTIETLSALIKVCSYLDHQDECNMLIEKYESLTCKR